VVARTHSLQIFHGIREGSQRIKEDLIAVGETVSDKEVIRSALKGLPKEWDPFVSGMMAREKLPTWDRLWGDCCQE
jgi:hypothetical protein